MNETYAFGTLSASAHDSQYYIFYHRSRVILCCKQSLFATNFIYLFSYYVLALIIISRRTWSV